MLICAMVKMKLMKAKIVLKFFCFLLVAYGLYWASVEYIFLAHLHPAGVRARLKNEFNRTQVPRDEVDYLILGDSSAFYTINPKLIKKRSYSLAQLGATVAESKKVFKELGVKKINYGVILIQTFIEPHYDEDIWRIFVPQKMMNLSDVISTFCGDFQYDCSFYKKASLTFKYMMYRMHLNGFIGATISFGLTTQIRYDNKAFAEHIKHSIRRNNGHDPSRRNYNFPDKDFFTVYWKNFSKEINPPEAELTALRDLADMVKKYGVNLYVVHPQIYRAESFIDLKKYNDSYKRFLHKQGDLNFYYIDLNDFNVVLDRKYYRDVSHANEDGSRKITQDLIYFIETSFPRSN